MTDEEVKDFVAINFSEYFKSVREKLFSKLNEEQNLRKVAILLYIFLSTPDKVEKYVQSSSFDNCTHRYNGEILIFFDPELQLINNIPVIKNKLKEFVYELKKFKVQAILVLDNKKKIDRKIFHSSATLIASDSYVDDAFKSMYKRITTKIKNYACEDWIALDLIIKHSIRRINGIKNGVNK